MSKNLERYKSFSASVAEIIKQNSVQFDALYSNVLKNSDQIKTIFDSYSSALSNMKSLSSSIDYSVLYSSISAALRASQSYLTEEQKAVIDDISPELLEPEPDPAEDRPPRTKITRQDLLSIFSILISVFFGIIQLLPNEQLDEIIEGQNAVISVEESIAEQNRESLIKLNETNLLLQQLIECADSIHDALDEFNDDGIEFSLPADSFDDAADGPADGSGAAAETEDALRDAADSINDLIDRESSPDSQNTNGNGNQSN